MNKPQPLSEESVAALEKLGEVLLSIRIRLISEGYVIRDGQIYKPTDIEDLGV
jgi:hypothetical protein